MLRLIYTSFVLMLCSQTAVAVTAYAVADDNFDLPDHLVEIDLETGQFVSKGQLADPYIAIEGLAISENGVLYGADDNTKTLVQINVNEGRAFAVANANQNFGFGAIPDSYDFGMSFSCNNNLYLVVKHTQELYQVDTNTGAAQLIGDTQHSFTSLASWGGNLYAVASGDFNLYQIDPATAQATVVGSMGDLGGDISLTGSGLSFDDQGQLWMIVNLRLSDPLNPFPSRIFKLDHQTGQAQLVSETLVGVESLAIAPPGGCDVVIGPGGSAVAVPTNSQWALMTLLLSLLAVGGLAIRNKQF